MGVERAIVYIDGFNLYHGLMQARLGSSRWLDLGAMSRSLLGAPGDSSWSDTSRPGFAVGQGMPNGRAFTSTLSEPTVP